MAAAIKVYEKYKGPADMSKDELAILERARKATQAYRTPPPTLR